jgi:membrane protein
MFDFIDRRWRARGKQLYEILDETWDEYSADRAEMVAAGLAFFTLLSLAPLIIIAVAIAGAVLGHSTALEQALLTVHDAMGADAAQTVRSWVQQASDSGAAASVVGFVLVLYTASRLGEQLRVALNQVWNVDERQAEGFKASVTGYLRRRLFAFLLVLTSGPLLLVVFASRAGLWLLTGAVFPDSPWTAPLMELIQVVFSLVSVAAASAVVFKVVPDTRVGWRAVMVGAVVTSLLFNIGNWLVSLYLAHAAVARTYGAAGSAIVVLIWLYFSAQMFLFGAELTQVYARHFGRGLSPAEANEVARAGQVDAQPAEAGAPEPALVDRLKSRPG